MLVDGNGIPRSGATPPPPPSPQQTARTLLDQHRQPNGYDVPELATSMRSLSGDGTVATVQAIEAQLSPVERGQLAAIMDANIRTVNGQPYAVGDPTAPPIATWGQQPAGSPYRQTWDGTAAALDTSDPAAVQGEIERQLYGTTAAPTSGPGPVQLGLDLGQMALDLTGIVDPTPISDGANAVVSVGRSIGSLFSGHFSDAGGHLANAGISVVGIVPALGDLAKAGKIGKWAQTVTDSVSAIAHNPALRATLEPGLKAIRDAVGKIPQGAMDALPSSVRQSLEGMKRQLDEFFAPAAKTADPPPATTYHGTVGGKPIDLPNVDALRINYVKRDRVEYAALRDAFDGGVRADFAKSLVSTPEGIAAIRRAGLDDAAIARLADGKIPTGYQVHHKLPLDDGGTNAFENLVLIKNSPYHTALTNAQRTLVGDLPVGGSRQVDFPVPRGSIYPSGE